MKTKARHDHPDEAQVLLAEIADIDRELDPEEERQARLDRMRAQKGEKLRRLKILHLRQALEAATAEQGPKGRRFQEADKALDDLIEGEAWTVSQEWVEAQLDIVLNLRTGNKIVEDLRAAGERMPANFAAYLMEQGMERSMIFGPPNLPSAPTFPQVLGAKATALANRKKVARQEAERDARLAKQAGEPRYGYFNENGLLTDVNGAVIGHVEPASQEVGVA